MPAIELIDLCKTYKNSWGKSFLALDNLNLTIEEGEVFGFVGPNGAGKSTTIKMIMGLLKATSGVARLYGKETHDHHSRNGVAYVPESPLLYDYLTPFEILKAGCQLHKVNTKDNRSHCMNWLERFDIARVANKPLRNFSKGMVQRTALAHALAIQPKLLILDEPLSGLDPIGRKLVLDVLTEYRQNGMTLFFSSHVLYDVERLADRYGLIHKGQLRTVRSPDELIGNEATVLITSFGNEPIEGMNYQGSQRWQGEVSRANLWQTIEHLRQSNHRIHEIRSNTTLEQAFFELVEGGI